jgi:hypothetical protein
MDEAGAPKSYAVRRRGSNALVIVMRDPDAQANCKRWIEGRPRDHQGGYYVSEFKDE